MTIHDDTKAWLRSIVDFPGTTPEARDFAQQLLDILANPQSGAALIAAERLRQVEGKGYTQDHDDSHQAGEIAAAAGALAIYHTASDRISGVFPGKNFNGAGGPRDHPVPFRETWMQDLVDTCRHKTDVRRLAIAGALIAAEIDRLQRRRP